MALGKPFNAALRDVATAARARALSRWQRLAAHPPVQLLIRTVRELSEDDATHMAAGVAYYALFSMFPLLLGLIALSSFFLETEEAQARVAQLVSEYLPGTDQLVLENVQSVLRLRGTLSLLAIAGLLWSGSGIFGALNRAVNRAWDVRDRPLYKSKPRHLLMALGVGSLFALSVVASAAARLLEEISRRQIPGLGLLQDSAVAFLLDTVGLALLRGGSFLLTFLIFLLIYKYMPNTRTYWRFIWPGALVGAVLFEVSKTLFILYIDRLANFENVYGSALAPVVALLLWVYVGAFIVILGAELASEYGRMVSGVERGRLLHPRRRDNPLP